MKKLLLNISLIAIVILGLNTSIYAIDFALDIDMIKKVSSAGDMYSIIFHIEYPQDADVKRVEIKLPNKNKMALANKFKLNEFQLFADSMAYAVFMKRFPVGIYTISLFPRSYGTLKVNLSHDFLPTPVITYPNHAATGVPLTPTITWMDLGEDMWSTLYIEGNGSILGEIKFKIDLPPGITSYTVPSGLFEPNQEYEITLAVGYETESPPPLSGESSIETHRFITFTTGGL